MAAYQAPVALLTPPGASRLMHEEPFGSVDTIVVVDTEAELLAQMNASNEALVASIVCDDADPAGLPTRPDAGSPESLGSAGVPAGPRDAA
jgi:acyl-CoA reductase-like NAD-dependent aldehyde dehydrogenase